MLALAAVAALATSGAVELDAARWEELVSVGRVTADLPTVSDRARFGRADYWRVADAQGGDCEDKALLARARLIAAGWPAEALRLALVRTETGDLHAVLTAEVDRDGRPSTYVLDSRFATVLPWDALTARGYRWVSRQGPDGRWRRIRL